MVSYTLAARTRQPYQRLSRMEVRVAETVKDFMVAAVILDRTFGHLASSADYFSQLIPQCELPLLAVQVYESKQFRSETIMGVYLLREANLANSKGADRSSKYRGLRGVEGVALAVDKAYRNRGVGRLLREYSLTLDFDYIWGMQFKSLDNLDNWLKSGRELIYQTGDDHHGINCTARMMPPKKLKEPEVQIEEVIEPEAQDFPHQVQRDVYSCGATCVEMYLNWTAQGEREVPDIEDIKSLCGTNTTTGTITEGILDCFQTLAVPAWRSSFLNHKGDDNHPLDWLEGELIQGRGFLVRTLTHGCKHWILCYGFYYLNGTRYWLIADPASQLIEMVDQILIHRWKPRDWDGVVVDAHFPIKLDDWAPDDWHLDDPNWSF